MSQPPQPSFFDAHTHLRVCATHCTIRHHRTAQQLFDAHTHQRRHEHHVIQQRRTTAPQSLTLTPAPAYRTAQKQWGSHGSARLRYRLRNWGELVRMRVRPCVYSTLATLNAGGGAWGGYGTLRSGTL
jgi:hypothetical protein